MYLFLQSEISVPDCANVLIKSKMHHRSLNLTRCILIDPQTSKIHIQLHKLTNCIT